MLPSNCNTKNCPGAGIAIVAGILMMIAVTVFGVVTDAHAGEVRVEITRELPDEKQLVVQQFHDEDSFAMWMVDKLDGEGCDPYVSDIRIIRNYQPPEQSL
jgi:hypothetical protein